MSFEDWYNPARNSPSGPKATTAGMQAGLQIGSLFGPVGAGIGAGVGIAVGAFSGNGARKRAMRRATNESYRFGKEVFTYAGETRAGVRTDFERNKDLLTARMGATGATASDSYKLQLGKLAQVRDSALSNLEEEVSGYRQGPNYEWFRKDYERVTGVVSRRSGRQDGDAGGNNISLSIGGVSRGSAKNEAYSESQRKQMRTATASRSPGLSLSGKNELYTEYAKRIAPTMEWYERKVFGGKSDRKAYDNYIDERIKKANKWYDAEFAIKEAADARRQQEERGRR